MQTSEKPEESRAGGSKWPTRRVPAEAIVLEDGATTFVSSLEDFIAKQGDEKGPKSGAMMEPDREPEVGRDSIKTTSSNETNKGERNSRLAIAFTSEPAEASTELPAARQLEPQSAAVVAIEHPTGAHKPHKEPEQGHSSGHAAHEHADSTTGNKSGASKPIPQHWQVKSLLNVTNDYPLAYSQVICGYVWPLMAAITLFTNLMIVFVLTQRDMRTPTNVVLTAIAIADIIPIVVPVPWFVYLFAMGNEKQVLYPPVACYFYQHSTRSVSEIFYFLSTWLNVLLAIQDYLTACQPKLAQKYCQIRVVVVEIVLLTLLAFLLNLPQALKLVFKPVKFYYNGQLTLGCKALQARWFKDLVGEYVAIYDDIFTAIIVLFVDGGPAVVLITLTALLIRQLHRHRIQGHKLMEQARTASKRRRERHRQQEYEASARVMIFVLIAFLAVKIPFATTYTLMIIQSRFEIHFVENLVDFQKAITLTDLVFVLSYPINFTIFCCCSKKFRHKCAQLLGECNDNSRSARTRLMSNISDSFNSAGSLRNSISRHLSIGAGFKAAPTSAPQANQRDHSEPELRKLSLADFAHEAPQVRSRASSRVSSVSSSSSSLSFSPVGAGSVTAANRPSLTCSNATNEIANHHHQQLTPTDSLAVCEQQHKLAPDLTGAHLRRLLDEGGLCLECIVCYERIKSASSAIGPAGAQQAGELASVVAAAAQADHSRRMSQASDSSASWSTGLTALPQLKSVASLQQQQQRFATMAQLPQIVTTACESIREQTSTEEAWPKGEGVSSGNRMSFREIGRAPWELATGTPIDANERLGGTNQDGSKQEKEEEAAAAVAREEEGGISSNSERDKREGQEGEPSAEHWEDLARVQRSKSRDANYYEPLDRRAAGRSLAQAASLMMTRVSISDPSDVSGQLTRQQQEQQDRWPAGQLETNERDERDEDRARGHEQDELVDRRRSTTGRTLSQVAENCASSGEQSVPTGKRRHQGRLASGGKLTDLRPAFESRQRSLSLSSSNLTTLPNATGMLADVLVSILFAGAGGRGRGRGRGGAPSEQEAGSGRRKKGHKK